MDFRFGILYFALVGGAIYGIFWIANRDPIDTQAVQTAESPQQPVWREGEEAPFDSDSGKTVSVYGVFGQQPQVASQEYEWTVEASGGAKMCKANGFPNLEPNVFDLSAGSVDFSYAFVSPGEYQVTITCDFGEGPDLFRMSNMVVTVETP